jgi:hypothetical protein
LVPFYPGTNVYLLYYITPIKYKLTTQSQSEELYTTVGENKDQLYNEPVEKVERNDQDTSKEYQRQKSVKCSAKYHDGSHYSIIEVETRFSLHNRGKKKYVTVLIIDGEEVAEIPHIEPFYVYEKTRNDTLKKYITTNLSLDKQHKSCSDIILSVLERKMKAKKEDIKYLDPNIALPGENTDVNDLINEFRTYLAEDIEKARSKEVLEEEKPPQTIFDNFVPKGYVLREDGIYEIVLKTLKDGDVLEVPVWICSCKVMVIGRFTSLNKDEGEDLVEIQFIDNLNDGHCIVPLSAISDTPSFRKYLKPRGIRVIESSNKSFSSTWMLV